jgi:hypothetical protein
MDRMRRNPKGGLLALGLALASAGAPATTGAEPASAAAKQADSDDAFVQSLADRYGDRPVDTTRLARLLDESSARVSDTLKTLEYLQMRVAPRDGNGSARGLAERFEGLTGSVARFRASTGRLAERPDSPHLLFVVMARGQRACVDLDEYLTGLRRAGLGEGDRVTTGPAVEACSRFREIVFQPRVEGIVLGALSGDEEAHARRGLPSVGE